MPFDFAGRTHVPEAPDRLGPPQRPQPAAPTMAGALHGVPRARLAEAALAQLAPSLRREVAALTLEDGGRFVSMGANFDRVTWRAAFRRPGLPAATGSLPVLDGEIVG